MTDSNIATITATPTEDEVVTQLRKALSEKNALLAEKDDQISKEKASLKKARAEKRELSAQVEGLSSEIADLKSELENASVVEVSNNSGNEKIQKALFRLDTILMMNGEKESVSLDHLKLVVQDLTGAEQQTNLLLTK